MKGLDTRSIGNEGEDAACEYLISEGYRIIERNYRCSYGETDIIACDEKYIIFVEVKARADTQVQKKHGPPSLAVNYAKQQRLLNCAHYYMHVNRPGKSPRIDVMEILMSPPDENGRRDMKFHHIRAAVTER